MPSATRKAARTNNNAVTASSACFSNASSGSSLEAAARIRFSTSSAETTSLPAEAGTRYRSREKTADDGNRGFDNVPGDRCTLKTFRQRESCGDRSRGDGR
jgi:hypothetical protein